MEVACNREESIPGKQATINHGSNVSSLFASARLVGKIRHIGFTAVATLGAKPGSKGYDRK